MYCSLNKGAEVQAKSGAACHPSDEKVLARCRKYWSTWRGLLAEKKAFLLNRFLLEIQIESLDLVKKFNLTFAQFDSISKKLIPDFGIFELVDHVGHQTMYSSIENYASMSKDKFRYTRFLDIIEIKINRNENFSVSLENCDVSSEDSDKVLIELRSIIKVVFTNFLLDFDLEAKLFKSMLVDFCGLNI